MEVISEEAAFRAHCERCGDSFEVPYEDLRSILGATVPSPQALAASLTCVCSLNEDNEKTGASAPLWRWPTVRSQA